MTPAKDRLRVNLWLGQELQKLSTNKSIGGGMSQGQSVAGSTPIGRRPGGPLALLVLGLARSVT